MENKKKFRLYILAMCLIYVLVFASIGLTVYLTGGRELSDFTPEDWRIFWGMGILDVALVAASFVLAVKAGKINPNKPETPKPEKWEKITAVRGFILSVLGFAAAIGLMLVGVWLRVHGLLRPNPVVPVACCVAIAGLFVLNLLLSQGMEKRFTRMPLAEARNYLQSHREEAEKTAREKQKQLRTIRLMTGGYAALLGVLAAAAAIQAGAVGDTTVSTLGVLAAGAMAVAVTTRVRFGKPRQYFTDAPNYLTREDYPLLYEVADRAQKAAGCKGEFRLMLQMDFGAGIAQTDDVHSVNVGVQLLNSLTEQEIFSVLCHEFAHETQEDPGIYREMRYCTWLESQRNPHYTRLLSEGLFRYPYALYLFQYLLFDYAVSLSREQRADRVMAEQAGAEASGSALTKGFYSDLFEWEISMEDSPCIYAPEEPDWHGLTERLTWLREATPRRKADWDAIAQKEIQTRNASHPTLAQRLELMGAEPGKVLPYPESGAFYEECRKALAFAEEWFLEQWKETYEEERKTEYLEPLELVTTWEQAGKPIRQEEYADVLDALAKLGRFSEAAAFCDRVIGELSGSAANTALYFRGSYRLCRYDEAGLEDLMQAMDNPNFIDGAMDRIGRFLFLMGREDDVEEYRQRSLELGQRQLDEYDELSRLGKKDRLSADQLPEGMQEEILNFILSIAQDSLTNVYLVRKTISDRFFSSVFVLRFRKDTPAEVCDKVYHQVFRYLDALDWQFSLFDYRDLTEVKVDKIENTCIYTAQ